MPITHHQLGVDFPEYRQAIHDLKMSTPEFAKLIKQYDELDDEIYRIEAEIETPSDEYTESLKMKRVEIKDKLIEILQKYT